MDRSAHPRTIALASAAALAALLPTAAAGAGPVRGDHEPHPTPALVRAGRSPAHPETGILRLLLPESAGPRPAAAGGDHLPGTGPAAERVPATRSADGASGASCGPALVSREGLRAQTCLVREGGRIWARSYYRNATGAPLQLVLALTRPDGHAVQVHCPIPAAEANGTCETPRRGEVGSRVAGDAAGRSPVPGSAGGLSGGEGARALPYGAVAEVASQDGSRLLLRSGSNAPAG